MLPDDCLDYRCRALERDAAPTPIELQRHSAACPACAAWRERLPKREELIRSLPRHGAPDELHGRVVAALQAGVRQERAIRALEGLGRLCAPTRVESVVEAELEAAVRDPLAALAGRQSAPQVLDRLVEEELGDTRRSVAARHVGSLPRLEAPAELAQRVSDRIAQRARPEVQIGWWLAAAAALVVTALAPMLMQPEPPRRPFRVEYVDSFVELSDVSRGLLDTASSGMVSTGKS